MTLDGPGVKLKMLTPDGRVFLEDPSRNGIQNYGLMKRDICIQRSALHEIAGCICVVQQPPNTPRAESRRPLTPVQPPRGTSGGPLTLVLLGWPRCPLADTNYRPIEDDSTKRVLCNADHPAS